MGAADYLLAIKPDTAKLRKIIENGLLFDWIIRIEYTGGTSDYENWLQWKETHFAIRSAESVLAALKRCYEEHPDRLIRINAEKMRPQTRMVYTAYNPEYVTADDTRAITSASPRLMKAERTSVIGMMPHTD